MTQGRPCPSDSTRGANRRRSVAPIRGLLRPRSLSVLSDRHVRSGGAPHRGRQTSVRGLPCPDERASVSREATNQRTGSGGARRSHSTPSATIRSPSDGSGLSSSTSLDRTVPPECQPATSDVSGVNVRPPLTPVTEPSRFLKRTLNVGKRPMASHSVCTSRLTPPFNSYADATSQAIPPSRSRDPPLRMIGTNSASNSARLD